MPDGPHESGFCPGLKRIPHLGPLKLVVPWVHACATSSGKAKWSGPQQRRWKENEFKFHSVTSYTNSTVSLIHVHIAKLRNITCTLVATNVIPWSLECTTFIVKAQNLSAAEAPPLLPRRLHPYPGFIFTLFSIVWEYPVNNNSRESSWGWVFLKLGLYLYFIVHL